MKTTVKVIGLEFEVDCSISPAEAPTYYDSNGDPGNPECGGEVEIYEIWYKGVEVSDIISETIYDKIEEAL